MCAAHSTTRIIIPGPKSAFDSARASVPDPTPSKGMPIIGDQPTVISSQPPLPAHSATDSAHRIMEGRIMPGDHLGHFELLDYVGGGGMGRVFRASDTRLARIVALKVLSPEQAADAETVQRFQNEAQSAARLDHDNIARVHYVGEDRGIHFIAFEFVEGVNIRVLVEQRGPLPLGEAASYTLQVAEALAHADERSVVHRDIKPSNVIITPEGRVKLIDMGLARLRQVDPEAADLTASGVTLGTFDYISPEQARDPRNADTRSDIYSLGCTFFFMLAGRPPFLEGTVLQKLLQHQSEQPPDVREFRPDLPEETDLILKKMLAKDPQNRYRNAGELALDLQAIAERLGLQPPIFKSRAWPAAGENKPSFWRRHLPWMASVAALLIIVVGLEVYWTVTAPSVDPRNPTLSAEEDFTSESPASTHRNAAHTPLNNPDKNKSAAKNAFVEKPENDLPASPSKTEQNVDRSPNFGDASPMQTNLNFGMPGDSSIPPKVSSTGESYFQGLDLENRQPFAEKMSIAPSESPFPPNMHDSLGASWRIPPTTADSPSANPGGISAKTGPSFIPAESAANNKIVWVVSDVVNGENEFTTLGAACAKARNGDTIELRYNGPRKEKPLHLSNRRLTISAGAGYSPVLAFQPDEADPVKYSRGMFTLQSGRLNLNGVAIELVVPRNIPAENWSLFEIHGGQTVLLDRCALTIINASPDGAAYHPDTAFFRVLAASETESAIGGLFTAASPLATIALSNSLARGEAVFLRVEDSQPAFLNWENGLLTTSESMLLALGGTKEPKSNESLHIRLRHVTAITRGGVCRLTGTPAAYCQLAVQLDCTENIFKCLPSIPLIRQEGAGTLENLLGKIVWNGDMNFYDGIDIFWSIRRFSGDAPANSMGFGSWLKHWGPSRENQPMPGRIDWMRLPEADRPAHLQTAADYELNRERENPALGGTSDGRDAGVKAELLPPLSDNSSGKAIPKNSKTKGRIVPSKP